MKKATNTQEQINILKERGMLINDEKKADETLLDIGYYRLGFYSFPFEESFPRKTNRTHILKTGTAFEDIVSLYYFDFELRNILIKYLHRIEVNIRTYITYTVSNHYKDDPTWFIDTKVVDNEFAVAFEKYMYPDILKNPVICRHREKYTSDHFAPAWKTLEFMTLGNMYFLYRNIKDCRLKEKIAQHYGCRNIWIFINYLKTIKIIRNACAHGSCIYNIALEQGIKAGPAGKMIGNNRQNICGAIKIINYMVGKMSTSIKDNMNQEITSLLQQGRRDNVIKIIRDCTGLM